MALLLKSEEAQLAAAPLSGVYGEKIVSIFSVASWENSAAFVCCWIGEG
jgi:hypothetical protein